MAKLQSKVEEVLAIECDCKHSRHSPSNGGDKLVIVARDRGVNLAGDTKNPISKFKRRIFLP